VKFGVEDARNHGDRLIVAGNVLQNMPKPTIAMIAGVCMGGGLESVLLHDLKICADNAKFGQPEINVGIFPGAGATQRLPQLMSLSKAKELVFLGEPFDAQTALELGIVNKVVPLAELKEETMKMAKKLLKKPAFALRMAKEALNSAWSTSMDRGLMIETHGWAMCYGTQDQKEGMNAFIEKRKPAYTGH
jgi:enoyl-CoA hydratase